MITLGLEEMGTQRIQLNTHLQAGLYLGSHLSSHRTAQARVALGYYSGMDPSLKYAQFQHSRIQFIYAGLLFDF
jgi:hypothetical protein